MTENDRIPELLSPAGSFASAMAAFHAGADAVYLAGNRFGARAYAENFSEDDIIRCIRYAHLYSKKVYLTLNILIKESEIREIEGFMRPLYEAGLDGVIIQDLGIVSLLHDLFPHLPLHASTQMSITGYDGVSFLEKYGISRVVPARELSLNEIESIIAHEDASELECFIHGAMCYCYSGQCLFSSVLGGRSGNRGRCAQPCRLGYEYLGEDPSGSKNGNDLSYILSMKDLCTVDRISELTDAGIASFKIEGRMKSPEYSAGVTSVYRKAIDDHLSGIDHDAKKDVDLLKGLYMRTGIYEGYYDTRNTRDMITVTDPGYSGNDQDTLNRIKEEFVDKAFTAYTPPVPVWFEAEFVTGKEALLSASCSINGDKISYTSKGNTVDKAQKSPISESNVSDQLSKLSGTIFIRDTENESIKVSDDAFYPLKGIGELRRSALKGLEDSIIAHNGLSYSERSKDRSSEISKSSANFENVNTASHGFDHTVSVLSLDQLKAVYDFLKSSSTDDTQRLGRIYVDESLIAYSSEAVNICRKIKDSFDIDIFIALIPVRRENKRPETDPRIFTGYLIRSIDDLGYYSVETGKTNLITDSSIYVWNDKAASLISENASGFTLPNELSGKEIKSLINALIENRDIYGFSDSFCRPERVVYGKISLMRTANCVRKTCYKCKGRGSEPEFVYISDRKDVIFPVYTDCGSCLNTICNSAPLDIPDDDSYISRSEFTDESYSDTVDILEYRILGTKRAEDTLLNKGKTSGWSKRPVE